MAETRRTGPGSDVFILGAGFSRAISDEMPLTADLATRCRKLLSDEAALRLQHLALDERDFESILSYLATTQPYLDDVENARNEAVFREYSAAVHTVVSARQEHALGVRYPEWLAKFLITAHHRQATLITFNYDTLVECFCRDPTGPFNRPHPQYAGYGLVDWTELIADTPPWPPGPARAGGEQAATLRLLKLHGR